MIDASFPEPVSVPELEAGLGYLGNVRREVKDMGTAGLVTYDESGYILTQSGIDHLTRHGEQE